MDVGVKFGDSRSSRSRDIRAARFVMDEQTTADAGKKLSFYFDKLYKVAEVA